MTHNRSAQSLRRTLWSSSDPPGTISELQERNGGAVDAFEVTPWVGPEMWSFVRSIVELVKDRAGGLLTGMATSATRISRFRTDSLSARVPNKGLVDDGPRRRGPQREGPTGSGSLITYERDCIAPVERQSAARASSERTASEGRDPSELGRKSVERGPERDSGGREAGPAPQRRGRGAGAAALAREIWSSIVHAVVARREYLSAQAAKFEVTLPQFHLLRLLEGGPAQTMASIAGALACDASNITGLVDRLEARGLIERRSSERDRRVKTIAVTPAGAALITRLKQSMFEPPDSFAELDKKELCVLQALLRRALAR
jgi:DNA-binding MarR family transcriptional regulator